MNDHQLNQMLHTWKAEADLPTSFQRDVWHRIEAAESARPASARWLELFLHWLARPLPATAVCTLALTAGLVAGGMFGTASAPSAPAAYANSINPLATITSR